MYFRIHLCFVFHSYFEFSFFWCAYGRYSKKEKSILRNKEYVKRSSLFDINAYDDVLLCSGFANHLYIFKRMKIQMIPMTRPIKNHSCLK